MSEHHTGFLSNIGRQLLVLAGGVVSVHTFIPVFINHLELIFSFSMLQALWVYTFLYFLLPALILFYLLITIRPRAGDGSKPIPYRPVWWKQPEGKIAVVLLCFTYLLLDLHIVNPGGNIRIAPGAEVIVPLDTRLQKNPGYFVLLGILQGKWLLQPGIGYVERGLDYNISWKLTGARFFNHWGIGLSYSLLVDAGVHVLFQF